MYVNLSFTSAIFSSGAIMKANPWVSGININPFRTSGDELMTAMDIDTPSPSL